MNKKLSEKLSFLNDNIRFKALFLLLLRSEGYIKSDVLANYLNVTARTIKNDLKLLKLELYKIGIDLISKQSKGYYLKIDDKENESFLKEYFQIYQPTTIDNDFDTRVQYILRRILTSEGPIKLENLQDELWVNINNSLRKELNGAKKILLSYNLKLLVRPHYGMYIEGNNFNKTMLIVRMYKFFNKDSTPNFGIESFESLFKCDENEKNSIRKMLFNTLTKSRIVFSDIYAERFIVYIIYLRNQYLNNEFIDLEIPNINFNYKITDEYKLVFELIQELKEKLLGFNFSENTIRFLTYIAIISSDLYRFKDCTKEKYDMILEQAEEIRNFMVSKFSEYLQINIFNDYTCIKDLLKIVLPISLKIELYISDDVDLGFYNMESMQSQPILLYFMDKLSIEFYKKYKYIFSKREKYLIFNVFLGMVNRIILPHSKLNLVIIAIDGRLSTQHLKFNLKHYFSEFIERIETKVLYELESMEVQDYDYYLCTDYGKNMNIPYSPIYFADQGMTESEYVESLNQVFFDSFGYDKVMPKISFNEIKGRYKFEIFPIEDYLKKNKKYEQITIDNENEIQVYLNLNSDKDEFTIFYFENEDDITLHCEKYFLIIDLEINENQYKLKMLLNVLNKIAEKREILLNLCKNKFTEYKYFFINH